MFDNIRKKIANTISKSYSSFRFDVVPFLSSEPDTQNISRPETFYKESLYFSKAIDKRAEVISGIEFKAVNDQGNEVEEVQNLLENPNKLLKGRDLIATIQKHFDIYGEFYLWKEMAATDNVRALHIINPQMIEPQISEGQVQGYKHKDKNTLYDPEEIIWQHRPNPLATQQAKSLLNDASKETLRAEIELRRYQAKLARSGGRFNGVISFSGDMTEEQIHKAKERYEQQMEEAKNSRAGQRPFFAGGDIDVSQLEHSPKELDYLNSKQSILEEVSTITGVPKTILSTFDDIKYNNAQQARITFLQETIKPLVEKLSDTLTEELNATITYEDFIPEDHEQKMDRIQTGADTGALTPNEIREKLDMEELDIEDANKPHINMNKIPLDENPSQ